jgi:hypothetical protein
MLVWCSVSQSLNCSLSLSPLRLIAFASNATPTVPPIVLPACQVLVQVY